MRFYTTHPYKSCCKNEVINFFIGFSVVHTIVKPECFANNNEYILSLPLYNRVISILEWASWSTELVDQNNALSLET